MRYGLQGPNETICTACAAATHAIGYAARLVAWGRCDAVVEPWMKPWDSGPFPVIFAEAGGVFTDWNGRTDVRGQTAVLSRLQADLAQAQVRLGYTRISAPMNGTVVNIPVQEGQTVIAVQITPVMLTLADLDTITVRTKVPEVDIQAVKIGQKASFLTLSGEGQRYGGKVRVVQPVPERSGNAVFYNVLFDVDNRDGKLFSEMTVQVDIETGEAKGVLTMPMVSLGERAKDGRFAVTRLGKEGKQELVLVRTGLQDGAKVEVREGLKVGDKVLLAPPSAASAPAEAASSAASRASS